MNKRSYIIFNSNYHYGLIIYFCVLEYRKRRVKINIRNKDNLVDEIKINQNINLKTS